MACYPHVEIYMLVIPQQEMKGKGCSRRVVTTGPVFGKVFVFISPP